MMKYLLVIILLTTSVHSKASSLDDLSRQVFAKVDRSTIFLWRQKFLNYSLGYVDRVEYNNFTNNAVRLEIKKPFDAFSVGGDLTYISVSSTSASSELNDTAYRQYGKPSRLNLGADANFVFLEGVSSKYWSFIPELEFLLSASARFGADFYTETFGDFSSIFATEISSSLQNELLETSPDGMIIDPRRYEFGIGLRLDAYQRSGLGLYFNWFMVFPLGGLDGASTRITEISFGVQYAR